MGWTDLSIVRRQSNFVNFFDAALSPLSSGCAQFVRTDYGPLSSLPTLMTYWNGIQEVKLKQMSSTISRSTASSLCLSCSRTCRDNRQWVERERERGSSLDALLDPCQFHRQLTWTLLLVPESEQYRRRLEVPWVSAIFRAFSRTRRGPQALH